MANVRQLEVVVYLGDDEWRRYTESELGLEAPAKFGAFALRLYKLVSGLAQLRLEVLSDSELASIPKVREVAKVGGNPARWN